MAAAVSASIIMAMADGEFNHDEKDRIVEILGTYKRGLMSPQEILAMADQHFQMLSEAGPEAWPSLIHELTKGASINSKKTVLHAAGTMALSDGNFHEEEKKMIAQLAAWMELDMSQLREWTQEFDITMKHAEIMGYVT